MLSLLKRSLCAWNTISHFCSCSFAALGREIFHRIFGNIQNKEISVTNCFDYFIFTVVFLLLSPTYLSISFKFQSKGLFHLLFTHIMTKPRCSKCPKISKPSRPSLRLRLIQRLSHFTLEKTSQLYSLSIYMLLQYFFS